MIYKQATEAGELKEKHTNFQPAELKSQSSPQTIERYHGNSSRDSQTGRAGRRVGAGADREVRRFKDETPASETQVQREKKGVLNRTSAQSSILVLLSRVSLSYLKPLEQRQHPSHTPAAHLPSVCSHFYPYRTVATC